MTNQLRHSKIALPVLGAFLTLIAFAVSTNVIAPLITTIADDIAVNYSSIGYIIMFQAFSFFLAALIGGWISERYNVNSRVFVLVGMLMVGLSLLVGTTLTRLNWFMIWAIPLGLGGGLTETFASILVSNYEKPNSSKLLNLSQVFFCIGAISAPQAVAVMLYAQMSWEHIFILFGSFILLVMCAFFLLIRKGDRVAVHSEKIATKFSTPLLKDSLFFLLAAALLVYVTFESLISCWIPVYFEKHLSCSVSSSALRLSIFWTGLILGRLTIVIIPRHFSFWFAIFTGAVVTCICAFLACFVHSVFWATVLVFLTGFGSGPLWPTTVAICHAARKRLKFTSSVIAIGFIGVVLGSALGSIIFRYLDTSMFFPFVTIGSIIFLILSFFSYKKYSQNTEL